VNFLRTVIINESLEVTLSRDRLEKYLNENGQDLDAAIELYEKNTRLSEAFYTPLQCVEICLRNKINCQLSDTYGELWFQNGNPPLEDDSLRMIFEAKEELTKGGKVTPGRMVAELKFAFWVGLLAQKYDSTLWRKCLYKAFPAAGGRSRKTIHGRFNVIRRFRNRVAHHEPIFHLGPVVRHQEIIEAIGWMCRNTSAWALHHSRLPIVAAEIGDE
jgi:hypothetical protein